MGFYCETDSCYDNAVYAIGRSLGTVQVGFYCNHHAGIVEDNCKTHNIAYIRKLIPTNVLTDDVENPCIDENCNHDIDKDIEHEAHDRDDEDFNRDNFKEDQD